MKKLTFVFLAVILFGISGCKRSDVQPAVAGCAKNTAMVGMKDTYLSILCGCDEPAGTIKTANQPLTCTVPVNSYVVFDFSGTTLFHQVIAVGTPAMPASPVRNPSASNPIASYAFQPTLAGSTYGFQDRFETQLTGQIVTR